jgi:hypothetical protein
MGESGDMGYTPMHDDISPSLNGAKSRPNRESHNLVAQIC